MSFSLETITTKELTILQITDLSTLVSVEICTKGGLLNSWKQGPENDYFDIIDGNDFSKGWNGFEGNGFKSGKMNPYSCRLKNGQYQNESKHYKIEKYYLGAHAIHGLLYDAPFEIITTHCNDKAAFAILSYTYQKTDPGFPFTYEVQLKWTLSKENKVTVQTTITSKDSESFPMMDGWHPYFKLGDTIDDCTIQFTNKGILEYDDTLIPTGKIISNPIFEKGQLLAGIALDNGYLLDPSQPNCILENENYRLMVMPDAHYTYLQLYTPPHRKSIAIENLSAAPDCFNNKMGLHIMQPHAVWNLSTSFQLFRK